MNDGTYQRVGRWLLNRGESFDQLNLGLAVKSVTVLQGERRSELFFMVYVGSDASVQDGTPLAVTSRIIEGVERNEPFEFSGEGLLLVPPTEVRGGLVAFHVELWESDQKHRDLGEQIEGVTGGINYENPVVKALTGNVAGAAVAAVGKVAGVIGGLLSGRGDQVLVTWAGSLFTDQFDMLAGMTVVQESRYARVEYRVLVTEGEPPVEISG